jgi:hypothetical protein
LDAEDGQVGEEVALRVGEPGDAGLLDLVHLARLPLVRPAY